MRSNRHRKRMETAEQSVLLTGASGALGGALALHHARSGISLDLWGRDRGKLAEIAEATRAAGAKTNQRCQDLREVQSAVDAMLEDDLARRFDLAYLVAGIGDIRADNAIVEDTALVLRAAQVNFAAPAAMAAALAGRMAVRGHGRIVLVGSAAAHHSLPFAAAYAGSKAGLARFADALRIAVKPHGVSVTLAAPGFLDTPAARATSSNRPMELSVEEAAKRIARAGRQGKRHYVTPWPFALLKVLDSMLPAALRDRIMMRLDP